MRINKEYRTFIIVIVSFFIYYIARQYFESINALLVKFLKSGLLSYFLTYIIIGTPLFIGVFLINKDRNIFKDMGLSGNILKAFALALIFSIPMIAGGFAFYNFNENIILENLIANTIVIGFIEELYYRGFLFGQFFKNTKLGFISAIFLGAVLFGLKHLYQSHDPFELAGIFAVTFMGAILFAWLYVEWDYNLWVPIFLHSLMNLTWYIFEMDESALGNINSNIFRGLTISLAITLTVVHKRRQGQKLIVNRHTLFMKP